MARAAVRYRNTRTRYGPVARVLHWASVALLGAALLMAPRTDATASVAEAAKLAERHAVLGLALLIVMLSRLAWRASNPNPLEAYPMAGWAKVLAKAMHWFLYAAILTQCVLGMAQVGTAWLAVQRLVVAEDSTIAVLPGLPVGALVEMHGSLSAVILGAIGFHVVGVLGHQLFVR